MTLQEMTVWLKEQLSGLTDEWETESKWMLCHVLKCSTLDLLLYKNQQMESEAIEEIKNMVLRRQKREPIQYILGAHEFMGLPFEVRAGVLIPRQDTECLVDFLVNLIKGQPKTVLDIGTGSGAIAVSIAALSPYADVVSVDISKEALDVAEDNIRLNGVEGRVRLVESDLFEAIEGETFDIIVSNPPYIPESDKLRLMPEVLDYEPELALFGGEDGLDYYRRIIPEARKYLRSEGLLIFEAGHNQAVEISRMLEQWGYENIGIFSDLRGVPRFIYGYLNA